MLIKIEKVEPLAIINGFPKSNCVPQEFAVVSKHALLLLCCDDLSFSARLSALIEDVLVVLLVRNHVPVYSVNSLMDSFILHHVRGHVRVLDGCVAALTGQDA